MLWYWYIILANFILGVGVIAMINKPREVVTPGVAAFETFLCAIEAFAFWRIYDHKYVVIPIIVTISNVASVAHAIYMIDNVPRQKYWYKRKVLLTRIFPVLTIIGATVLYKA